jgi:hypothetical protein
LNDFTIGFLKRQCCYKGVYEKDCLTRLRWGVTYMRILYRRRKEASLIIYTISRCCL